MVNNGRILILNVSDYPGREGLSKICKDNKVILDFKLWDIISTMRRNIKSFADSGCYAVTISDHPLNFQGIEEAKKAGEEYGIKIIIGDVTEENW